MKIERLRPTVLSVTLHAYEMAALVAAARWVADGAEGELSPEIRAQVHGVLASYDEALRGASGEPYSTGADGS
ncbi:MAG: hypothetical protein R3195_00430 [Gemmatimonadota bacterium]|nr:hypothetical protein [Gemmatimonadota bacterium]